MRVEDPPEETLVDDGEAVPLPKELTLTLKLGATNEISKCWPCSAGTEKKTAVSTREAGVTLDLATNVGAVVKVSFVG